MLFNSWFTVCWEESQYRDEENEEIEDAKLQHEKQASKEQSVWQVWQRVEVKAESTADIQADVSEALSCAVGISSCSQVVWRQGRQLLGAVQAAAGGGCTAPPLGHMFTRSHLEGGPRPCQCMGALIPDHEETRGPGRGVQPPTTPSAAVAWL